MQALEFIADERAQCYQDGYNDRGYESSATEDFGSDYGYYQQGYYQAYDDRYDEPDPRDVPSFHAAIEPTHECLRCHEQFESNNKLHKHLKTCEQNPDLITKQPAGIEVSAHQGQIENPTVKQRRVIIPAVNKSSSKRLGNAFRSWHYTITPASLSVLADLSPESQSQDKDVCLDTGCTPTIVDRMFLKEQIPNAEVRSRNETLTINGIGSDKHQTKEFIRLFVRFNATVSGEDVVVAIPIEAHVVDGLRANLLIGMDTLGDYEFDLMLSAKRPYARIQSCSGAKIPLKIKVREGGRTTAGKPVFCKEHTIIPAGATKDIPVHFKMEMQEDRHYIFSPEYNRVSLQPHIVDSNLSWIVAHNPTNRDWNIPRRTRLGVISEFEETGACRVDTIADVLVQNFTSRVSVEGMTDAGQAPTKAMSLNSMPEMTRVLPNGITVYDDGSGEADLLQDTVMNFDIWRDKGFADVPEDQWMPIPMRDGWESIVDQSGRVYSASARDKKIIDEVHDQLHQQDRMGFATAPHQPASQSS